MNHFIESRKSDENFNKCYEYNEVSICMIDIVGFSEWCTKYNAKEIVKIMIKYNNKITKILNKYSTLTKIELVGDSCMIVGGMEGESIEKHVVDIVQFSLELLQPFTNTFNEETINVRIGIHIGNVFGTFILDPFKFQLYGNDINTTSRLESSSFPGVLHISQKVYEVLLSTNFFSHSDRVASGNLVQKSFKGVGQMKSVYLTIKLDTVMIIADTKQCQTILADILSQFDIKIIDSVDLAMEQLKENIYITVLMETSVRNDLILKEFRQWETIHRNSIQHIIGFGSYIELQDANNILYNDLRCKNEIKQIPNMVKKVIYHEKRKEEASNEMNFIRRFISRFIKRNY